MVSAEKLIALLDNPERFSFATLNYGATIGVALKGGQRKVWLCGLAARGPFDQDSDAELPNVTEEELAALLNNLPD